MVLLACLLGAGVLACVGAWQWNSWQARHAQAPAEARVVAEQSPTAAPDPADAYKDWHRPDGPPKIALQAGHWQATDAPDELANIRGNGARGGGMDEWEVNLAIAKLVAVQLQKDGYAVDILPATVPPEYFADAFVAIHADERDDAARGYKVIPSHLGLAAAPAASDALAADLDARYATATAFPQDPIVTDNMTAYYAFNWRTYHHALHPMTPAAIIETGYLSSARDRRVIVRSPRIPAAAIAKGIEDFMASRK
jgi:N-acetylmuramoyl-L-alanine amidase